MDQRLKVDLETILRHLQEKVGREINIIEWPSAIRQINAVLDKWEQYFERGEGKVGNSLGVPFDNFHNIAVEGMKIADAWMVTPELCARKLKEDQNVKDDNIFQSASLPFYRNAYRVLNSNANPIHEDKSPLKWLEHLSHNGGVENLILWLGSNNALGAVVDLDPRQTPGDGISIFNATSEERRRWNLWHPVDFEIEYRLLIQKTLNAIGQNSGISCNIFVGTIPLVTIAPITKGIGEARLIPDPSGRTNRIFRYYQDYTYFMLDPEFAQKNRKFILPFKHALFIDQSIIKYNELITTIISEANEEINSDRIRFHIVPISDCLTDMAWKRNSGSPVYKLPEELAWLYPPIDSKFYDIDENGKRVAGGLFGLDGIHPSVIGQGIIASEFLKAMKLAGCASPDCEIDWQQVILEDSLHQRPIRLMHEFYGKDWMIGLFTSAIRLLS